MTCSSQAHGRSLSLAFLAGALLVSGAPAQAQSSGGDWRQTIFFYGMGAGVAFSF